ncbi:T9SS type A sorting domain-containing protein [Ferruginibacter paludis]|uniref:T9SS type A sorting domain-containing protein n=1 Tax=Ferruginibacter paludis TaxID=1310417 RepID=UPI0025B4267C|nr:T9SS type A sorting domain-containing protein [Ferruginibacter paludis]MDN3656166.1 T9SS type A sorting domain-containing protein [Ferruginibacter paludis]
MNKNQFTTTVVLSLLFLSCNLFGQTPGGIGRHTLWLQGNFFADTAGLRTLNFNPVTAIDDSKTRVKMLGNIKDVRRATIFTVYQNAEPDRETPIWQVISNAENFSLSTRQVSSKVGETDMVFAKNNAGTYKAGKPETIIHTYTYIRSKGTLSTQEKTQNKGAAMQFGPPKSSKLGNTAPGLIAEFILYEKILKEDETTKIETYLALKYGITLKKNYVNSLGQTLWNWENEKLYSNNIAGIGRDNQSALYQKQSTSCSTPDDLVIGINKIENYNSQNTGLLNDKDYLIWGDNGQAFTLNTNVEPGISNILLSEKKWVMKAAGRTVKTISTELKIDTKTLLSEEGEKERFCLAIDRSGTGDFAAKNCVYIMPDSISKDGIASFSRIFWDTDGSGKDLFAFGIKPALSPDAQMLKNKDAASLISFKVYPNPVTDGHYKVALTLDKPADIKIEVYDIQQNLIDSKWGKGHAVYLLSGYINSVPGIYTVRVTTSEKEFSQIIILQ